MNSYKELQNKPISITAYFNLDDWDNETVKAFIDLGHKRNFTDKEIFNNLLRLLDKNTYFEDYTDSLDDLICDVKDLFTFTSGSIEYIKEKNNDYTLIVEIKGVK
jgi:hypothetical protein